MEQSYRIDSHHRRVNTRLTALEIETFQLFATGLTACEVAKNQHVHKSAIDTRLLTIRLKLNVSSTFRAWVLALQNHLLEYEPSIRTDSKRIRMTKREIEVLTLLGQGQTASMISQSLNTKKRMVDFHLSNIFQKLGVDNRYDAVKEGIRRGFILPPGP